MASASIVYRKPGTQPPIYVAGTFSNPPWAPYEMDYTTDADGEHTFAKRITAEPGSKIQYKFRVGRGDWWVLHDGLPTVTDAAGFKNHEMEVPQLRGPTEVEPAQKVNAQKHESDEPVSLTATTTNDETTRTAVKEEPEEPAKQSLPSYPKAAAQGTSTPDYANVAAEVADSAALLNEEEPETPVPDDLAGKIGYRRMSNTPIADVARTAAEVADTAKELDSDKPEFKFVDEESMQQSAPLFAHEAVGLLDDDAPEDQTTATHAPLLARQVSWGADGDSDDEMGGQPPLFAHEAMWSGESMPQSDGDQHPDNKGWEDEIGPDEDDIDVNDPTLERFPSNREDIIDAVRKLESGLNEDQVSFVEGVPLSPVIAVSESVTVSRLPVEESAGDFLLSPVPVSPVITRQTRGFDVSKSPRESIGSAHSSTASLQVIQEAEEPSVEEEGYTANTVQLSTPRARSPLRNSITRADSDEDEGVVMKEPAVSCEPKLNNGGLLFPGDAVPSSQISPRTVQVGTARLSEEAGEMDRSAQSAAKASEPSDLGEVQPSPRIVVEESGDVSTSAGGQTPRYNSEQDRTG